MSATDPEPRRLTPTERLQLADTRLHEVTLSALSRKPVTPFSEVEMTRNAKGDIQFTVTVRGLDPRACEQEAREIIERLAQEYPHSSTLPVESEPTPEPDAAGAANRTANKAAAIARKMVKS